MMALDAKVTLDANAEFRHEGWDEYEATQVRDDREQAAKEKGLQYVGLDGSVGIIANGAGLAMSTLDVVNQVGGSPANFLDIGGGANADVMAGALEIINNDPRVKSIFINIFGGITKGDEVANGIVTALGRVKIDAPIVIRIDGTNAEQGREILAAHEVGPELITEPDQVSGVVPGGGATCLHLDREHPTSSEVDEKVDLPASTFDTQVVHGAPRCCAGELCSELDGRERVDPAAPEIADADDVGGSDISCRRRKPGVDEVTLAGPSEPFESIRGPGRRSVQDG